MKAPVLSEESLGEAQNDPAQQILSMQCVPVNAPAVVLLMQFPEVKLFQHRVSLCVCTRVQDDGDCIQLSNTRGNPFGTFCRVWFCSNTCHD